jgi:beta-alanine degradation protein BauB
MAKSTRTSTDRNTVVRHTDNKASEHARRETLLRFSAAWAAGDVDTLLSLMSDEPIYRGSTGPGPGTSYTGREEVRAALQRMVGANAGTKPPAPTPPPLMHFFDDRALVFWRLRLPGAGGTMNDVDGVDVLTFTDDGRIAVKDAYRKAFS